MSLAAISARRALVAGLLTSLAAITTAAAFPHEKGSLTLARREFHAGDTLALAGGKFSPRGRLTLSLVGTGGRTVLGEVVTDSAGAFRAGLAVPAGLAPAPYRLVAVAEDGDEVASRDVVCSPPRSAARSATRLSSARWRARSGSCGCRRRSSIR